LTERDSILISEWVFVERGFEKLRNDANKAWQAVNRTRTDLDPRLRTRCELRLLNPRGSKKRLMTLSAEEFLRRFLLHTLPRGFVRIRSFGFLANRRRATLLPVCRQLLPTSPRPHSSEPVSESEPALWRCPQCGGPMAVIERLNAQQLRWELARPRAALDTS
jgi:hypothetical protein